MPYPHIDLLPEGAIIVIGARTRRHPDGSLEDNAHVFDATGAHLRAFCVGDGIEHIGVDRSGDIWVAYFDEGVFGDLCRGEPIGASGLVRFSGGGDRLWSYQPPWRAAEVVDCYALNVDARTTWIYYYTEFPLVRIARGRAEAWTPTPVRGARAVAVYDRHVIFVGDYDDPLRITCGRLAGEGVDYHGLATIVGPDDTPLHLFQVLATRGSRLYLSADRHVLLIDLADERNRPR